MFAVLFENDNVGVPLDVYWGVTVRFEPVSYEGVTGSPSMTCEWIPWDARTWRDLDGKSLSCRYGERDIEASFYFVAHDTGETTDIDLRAINGQEFDVTMSMVVDFPGLTGEDANPEMLVTARTTLPFEGVWFRAGSGSDEKIKSIAGRFLDLDDFRMSKEANGAVLFKPAID